MGKGSKQPTSQTVTQTSIPEEFYPYMERILQRGEAISNRPYEAYPGQRLADFSQDTQNSFDLTRQNVGSYAPFFQAGTNAVGQAMNGVQGEMANRPTGGNVGPGQTVNAGQWNSQTAGQYINPYMENTFDILQRREQSRFNQENQGIQAGAARAGAFGGARHGIREQMALDASNQRLMDAESTALKDAYGNAQQMFASDRDAALKGSISNQQTDLALQDLRGKLDIAGADVGMKGLGMLGQLGGQMSQMGGQYASLGSADAQALRNLGLTQEQLAQAGMDIGYKDFVNQRDYERGNLSFLAGLLQGMPVSPNSDVATYETANPYAQAMGAGLGLYGMAQNTGIVGPQGAK